MVSDWGRLGAELKKARKAARITQETMAEQLGVSRSAIQAIDRGDSKRVTPTIRAYAQAIGWDSTAVATVLAGGNAKLTEPEGRQTEPGDTSEARGDAPADLPLRVVHSLSEGTLIDATVIDLPVSSTDVRMTVVVRGKPGASPDEIKKALEAWERAERHLQHLDDDTNGT
ncbi:helix-turn-helix transcriptional regulator [Streptomyces axinellae]|uniref:HTH cro/C1-type domain-containing protein n=1 Tax=Streptomyces axinellae TaxID=552788 RepID=A0ABN3QM88_9ACTN